MDITLGLGVRRSPTAADLATIAGASSTAVRPRRPPSFRPVRKSRSCSTGRSRSPARRWTRPWRRSWARPSATAMTRNRPSSPALRPDRVGPVPGPGVTPRKRDRNPHLSRPYPHRIARFAVSPQGPKHRSVIRPRSQVRVLKSRALDPERRPRQERIADREPLDARLRGSWERRSRRVGRATQDARPLSALVLPEPPGHRIPRAVLTIPHPKPLRGSRRGDPDRPGYLIPSRARTASDVLSTFAPPPGWPPIMAG